MLTPSPRARRLVDRLEADGQPFLDAVVAAMIDGRLPDVTLLAVCPTSEAVTRAVLRVAERVDMPALFAATLNQVDRGPGGASGYTGWTPAALVEVLRREADRLGVGVPIGPGLDHGGPWMTAAHRGLDAAAAMAAAKASIEACLDAGYALLHLDATGQDAAKRSAPSTQTPPDVVVARTLELLAHAEGYRTAQDLPPVSYEVGTEEIAGGLADEDAFARFLADLHAGLDARGLARAAPCFVVGQVGTLLPTDRFDAAKARALTRRARRWGALVKGHDTDFVADPAAYPASGMGAANIGPECAAAEYDALLDLARVERRHGRDSGVERTIYEAVAAHGPWRKWLAPDERDADLRDLDAERQRWLVATGVRYVWTQPAVAAARAALYAHVEGVCDAEAVVGARIEAVLETYVEAFHLAELNARLEALG